MDASLASRIHTVMTMSPSQRPEVPSPPYHNSSVLCFYSSINGDYGGHCVVVKHGIESWCGLVHVRCSCLCVSTLYSAVP